MFKDKIILKCIAGNKLQDTHRKTEPRSDLRNVHKQS